MGELESALAVARAFTFAAPESCNADVAIILAESGKREEALAQLETNRAQFPDSFLTAMKSGEVFEVLGDPAAAEAAYLKAIDLGQDPREREEASMQLIGFLEDAGRADEIESLLPAYYSGKAIASANVKPIVAQVGRNDPCPCGSGKKYKKCHGA